MPLETAVLTPPSGSSITFGGSKWGLLELDLGNPARRDEMVTSLDASGSVPYRVAPRENREVTLRLQLLDAADMNAALNSIGDLEKLLEQAERIAADGWVDPVAESVRLVYTPAGSTQTYSLIVLTGEITGVPKTVSGDDAGYFIARPIVTVRLVCEPFAYGAARTYLDTTTASAVSASATVAGGPGDVAPWIRTAIKDVSTQSRGRLILGLKQGEAATTAHLSASGWTAVAGGYNAGPPPNMSVVTTDRANWQVLASIPRQTRTGTFRVYAHNLNNNGWFYPTGGDIRLAWSEVGGSLRRTDPVVVPFDRTTVFLGEVNADSSWDCWIETKGTVWLSDLILLPVDGYLETSGTTSGAFMVGGKVADDALNTTSTHIGGRTLTTGGTWSTVNSASPTWPVSTSNASRTATSMASPAFALAGTGNYIGVDLRFKTSASVYPGGVQVVAGAIARYVNSTNYLVFGVTLNGDAAAVYAVIAGTATTLGIMDMGPNPANNQMQLQVTTDGRWFASTGFDGRSGQYAALAQGGTLGDPSNAKVGLYDNWTSGTACTRTWSSFSASPLVTPSPPPIVSGATLTQHGVRLRNSDGADYTYRGSSGLDLRPGVNNNLTVVAHRSAEVHGAHTTALTDPLDIDIDGYPRFLSVPHT